MNELLPGQPQMYLDDDGDLIVAVNDMNGKFMQCCIPAHILECDFMRVAVALSAHAVGLVPSWTPEEDIDEI